MSFDRSGGPAKAQTRVDSGAIGLDAVGKTDEWGKLTGKRIVQPRVEVANAATCNQAAEALQQAVASGDPFVLFEGPLQSVVFFVVQLVRRSETQPT